MGKGAYNMGNSRVQSVLSPLTPPPPPPPPISGILVGPLTLKIDMRILEMAMSLSLIFLDVTCRI